MKVNKKDFENILKKVDLPIIEKNITDKDKYYYWYHRASSYTEATEKHAKEGNRKKYIENLNQSLLCTMEMHRFCKITKREFIVFLTLVRYHNDINKNNKIYFDKKGRRVKRDDRRAVRINSFGDTIDES